MINKINIYKNNSFIKYKPRVVYNIYKMKVNKGQVYKCIKKNCYLADFFLEIILNVFTREVTTKTPSDMAPPTNNTSAPFEIALL